jgi:Kdo2-lipid IVA lauroyltransferase/acyltransferase
MNESPMAKKRPFLKRAKYFLLYLLVKCILFLASITPRRWIIRFCGTLGGWAYYLVKDARQKTLRHLTMVYGERLSSHEIQRMAKRVFVMIGRNAGDILWSTRINDLESFRQTVQVEGEDYLVSAYESGKGVIALTSHLGAFELVGTYLAMMDYKPQIIGTRQKDERLHNLMTKNRNKRGAEAIERGKETLKLMRNLKSGGVLIILIDQDTKVKSVFVDFMGIPAATPVGAALFALRTGAKVVPMSIRMDEDFTQQLKVYPEVKAELTGDEESDIFALTQACSMATERMIQEDPTQWVWMHERWKTRPK